MTRTQRGYAAGQPDYSNFASILKRDPNRGIFWPLASFHVGCLKEARQPYIPYIRTTNMTNAEQQKCAHPSCSCQVPDGTKYCSQHCEDADGVTEISCDCGHPGCALE